MAEDLARIVPDEDARVADTPMPEPDPETGEAPPALYQSRFHDRVQNASLDLTNAATLEAIKKGEAPVPGQMPKQPAAPAAPGH